MDSGAAVMYELRKALRDRHTMYKRSMSVGVAWTAIEVLRETLPETIDTSNSSAEHKIQQQQDWYDPSYSDSNDNHNASSTIDRTEKAEHARYSEIHPTTAADATSLHNKHTRYTHQLYYCYIYNDVALLTLCQV